MWDVWTMKKILRSLFLEPQRLSLTLPQSPTIPSKKISSFQVESRAGSSTMTSGSTYTAYYLGHRFGIPWAAGSWSGMVSLAFIYPPRNDDPTPNS